MTITYKVNKCVTNSMYNAHGYVIVAITIIIYTDNQ